MPRNTRIIRFLWILGMACLILAIVVGLWPLCSPASPISAATLDKIRPGMPRAEVEELLGGPPGDYRHRGVVYDASGVLLPVGQAAAAEYSLDGTEEWRGDQMLIAVRFDRTGGVESAFGLPLAPPSWYRTLQRWLPFLG